MPEKTGKIEPQFFKQFIHDRCGKERQEVVIRPRFGVDVAVIRLPGGMDMALASDPLSLVPSLRLEQSAWLSVHLTANDIATTGFAPQYGQFVLNLPEHLSQPDFEIYWEYIHRFCKDIGLAITGGHTGFVEGQNSTFPGGATFIAVAPEHQMLTSSMARPGDVILVTKSCALSSAAILAMSFPETVKNRAGVENYRKAQESFYQISSLREALAAVEIVGRDDITAMHDVTEGGVLGAIYELAAASGNGAMVEEEKLPVGDMQATVCEVFSLDPRYCAGAGSMIITCKDRAVQRIISGLEKQHIPCSEVGVIESRSQGIRLLHDGQSTGLIYHQKDPYWDAYFKAYHSGWK